MAALKQHKTIYAPMDNAEQIIRVVYDFDEDGGTAAAADVLTAGEDLIVTYFHALVKTKCTSDGSATLDLGIKSGDTDSLLDAVAVASLTADSLHRAEVVETEGEPNIVANAIPFRLASGGVIEQTIGTAALTAGKVEYVFKVMKS